MLCLGLGLIPGSVDAASKDFSLKDGAVRPAFAVTDSVRPQKIFFRFRAKHALRVSVRIVKAGGGRTVRKFGSARLRPGRWHKRTWNGLDGRGRLVASGGYLVLVGPSGGRLRPLSGLRILGHRYPVDGQHGIRGSVGEFGAARNGGRIHEGFDITATCGTPLVAVRSGTILKTAYNPGLKGYFVILKGRSEHRTYLYAHLRGPAPVRSGQQVKAGRRIGTVGQTGNAASTPCHLHFEIRSRGRLLDPGQVLSGW